MGDPLITPDDLGIYLGDPSIKQDRAEMMIDFAQKLCEAILDPLPAAAAGIVTRMAGVGYVSTSQARNGAQLAAAGSPFGGVGGIGGVFMSRADERDLRRLVGGGGAFSIDMLPAGYATALPWWDSGVGYPGSDFDARPST